jgi:hypothetical protein
MKEEDLSSKKLKVLANQTTDYCDQTAAIKKTNEIRQKVAQAEVNQSNMDIMSKSEDDLPDPIAREFLQLQKESIPANLKQEIEEKRKAQTKSTKPEQSTSSSQNQQQQVPTSPSALPSNFESFYGLEQLSSNLDNGEEDDNEDIDPSLSVYL